MANDAKNLDKALELLRYLSRQDEPQNVAQLSRQLGVTCRIPAGKVATGDCGGRRNV